MTYSFIQRSGSAFTDTSLEPLRLDPLVVAGSAYRYDFINALSNPNPDGALANGASFVNLVESAGNASYTLSVGGFSVATGRKGITSPGTDTNHTSYIALPQGAYDMHTEGGTDHDFVHHLWLKEVTGYQTAGSHMFGDRIFLGETSPVWGATPGQFMIATGNAVAGQGAAPNAYIRANGAATVTSSVTADSLLNAAHLLSVAYEGGSVKLLVDGALFASAAFSFTFGLPTRRSHGSLVFAGNPSAADTVTINGNVITFVASGASGAQVNIGANATATAQALKTYINANKATLGATAEGSATTLAIINRSLTALLTLAKSAANITVGTPVAAKSIRLTNYMKGDYYAIAGEDLTVSGRTAAASALAEYNGYRPKLVAAGLAS